MVLFALTLLLLAGMVFITLGLAMRTRERMETQMTADAAAYSEAVVTARTFNAFAVLNRAEVAHWVVSAGTQALISWSGQEYAIREAIGPCNGKEPPTQREFNALDEAAAKQVSQQGAGKGSSMQRAGQNLFKALIEQRLVGQQLAAQIAHRANPQLIAPPTGAAKSLQEVSGGSSSILTGRPLVYASQPGGGYSCTASSAAVCLSGRGNRHTLGMVMGSLGWSWVHSRPNGTVGFGAESMPTRGTFYFSSANHMHPVTYRSLNGRNIWAHDHARSSSVVCEEGEPASGADADEAWVMSDDLDEKTDQHVYAANPAPGGPGGKAEPGAGKRVDEIHTFGSCAPFCPGIFSSFVDWNERYALSSGPANDFAQPKLYAVIQRDYAAPSRTRAPWELFFRFRGAGADEVFDNGSPQGRNQSAGLGSVLRNQVAVGAGLVYFHRPEGAGRPGWREPPNFFNPFWRATLAPVTGNPDDRPADAVAGAGFTEHAEALRALEAVGFRGGGGGVL